MARRPTSRPWTRLLSLAILIIAAYATILGAGLAPKLGLDLAGGTTVTLQPKSLITHQQPKKAALDEAVNILRLRVNGNGVGGATVQEQYPYIVASVPSGTRADVLATLSRTAQLYFREVGTGCASIAGQDNCVLGDPSLLTPAQQKQEKKLEASALASASAAAAKASAHPSSTASTTAAPAAVATSPTSPATTSSSTVSPVASSVASVVPSPSVTATTRGRPLSAALAAATPPPSATPPAATATTPAGVPTPTTPTAPVPSPGASANPLGPLPAGTGPINWTQAQAMAAITTLQCGNGKQVTRLGDFTASSWALGCGTAVNGGTDTNKYILMPAAVKGTSVKTATANPATTSAGTQQIATGGWEVNIDFKDSAFQKLTTKTANNTLQVAIVLDGVVESAPVNAQPIIGSAQITGNFNQKTATDLANTLKFGSLPLSFANNAQTETVSASLGKSSLNAGLLAGAIGLAIVVIYCFIYYRALGIVTVFSLVVSGSMVYAAVVLLGHSIGFTLSLAGIAGFIVAIGITADSFVVYYERIKDEIRDGRAARSAVESGWRAARRTIISADAVSLLAAVVLYVVTIGDVRGFALTLGLSTALDLVTVFFFTKPLLTILIQRPFFSTGKMSGLHADLPQAPIRRRPPGKGGSGVGRRPSSSPESDEAGSADFSASTPAEARP